VQDSEKFLEYAKTNTFFSAELVIRNYYLD